MDAADNPTELPAAAALASVYCSQAFYYCAEENILVHGGTAYTWEHSAQLYFTRAATGRVMSGDPARERGTLVHSLGSGTD